MKTTIEQLIQKAVFELFGISTAVVVESPELQFGDYTTNVALVVAKQVGKAPKEVAEELVSYLESKKDDTIDLYSIAGPGFINISLTKKFFAATIKEASENNSWGSNSLHSGKKILVEHSSPNLFKPFHVGHVMNNTIGESLVRLAKNSGADVTAISYPSDVSLGIGKAIWALLADGKEKLESLATIDEKLNYLGDCYVRGTKAYEEDESVQVRVREITKMLYDKTPGIELEAYEAGKGINLDYFLSIVKRLGSTFDAFIYESEAGEAGKKIVEAHTPGVFEESDGAVIYRGEQDGLHTRVFINKEGYPTYEAKDIGLLSLKFGKYDPDISILITDHQQASYYEVVLAAAGKIESKWKERMVHRTHGRMSFKGKKMASRLGGIPTAQTILDTVGEEVLERSADLSQASRDAIAIASLKFVILRAMAGKDIDFDPDTSLSFQGDSGPYLQYTAVRAGSILAKAKDQNLVPTVSLEETLTDVERLIAHFPDIVARATTDWVPHHIVTYLLQLSQSFNSWYATTKIIDEGNSATAHRLAVTAAVRNTISNGLSLLGIPVPEKM